MEAEVKQNDTSRSLTDTLTQGGSPIDLTGSTVKILFKLNDTLVEAAATIDADPTTGVVSAEIPVAVVSTVGRWHTEWEITYANQKQLSVPTSGYNTLIVNPDLNTSA